MAFMDYTDPDKIVGTLPLKKEKPTMVTEIGFRSGLIEGRFGIVQYFALSHSWGVFSCVFWDIILLEDP